MLRVEMTSTMVHLRVFHRYEDCAEQIVNLAYVTRMVMGEQETTVLCHF
jgi:hypothetical protein